MRSPEFDAASRARLLRIARESIVHGLEHGVPVEPAADGDPALALHRAAFVTLHRREQLRGCTGSLEPRRVLAAEVAGNAFQSAFRDPRFYPVEARELDELTVEVSVLSPLERMDVRTETELLSELMPGVHGLVIELGARRATFLPAVWESLPEPQAFLRALKRKAGLPEDLWSNRFSAYCYHTETFGETAAHGR
jgi:AmmeMemoRadiSam system protein A